MKISLNWLQNYISIDKSPREIADLLTQSGLEVEGLEKHEKIKGGLQKLHLMHYWPTSLYGGSNMKKYWFI